MNKWSRLKYLGFAALAILTTIFMVVFGQPSTVATSAVTLPRIQIKTPQELSLNYLNESILRSMAGLEDSIISRARDKVQTSANIPRAILIPTTGSATDAAKRAGISGTSISSVSFTSSTGETRTINIRRQQLAVFGARTPSGRIEPITPSNLDTMFAEGQRRGGLFNRQFNNLIHRQQHLVADASGRYAQANNIQTMDLIALDTDSEEILEIPGVDANSFFVDALNAVLDDTWVEIHDINSL